MEPQRIAMKYFVEQPTLDGPALVPTFHRWIQQGLTADTLLDVADYKHVHHGPHTLLVAHESDYVIDLADGRPGLLYIRKRWGLSGSLRERLQTTLHHAVVGAKTLADDPQPHGPISFRTDEVEISFFDRLHTPNTAETYEAVRGEIESLLGELYEGADVTLKHTSEDPRSPLTVTAKVSQAPALETLIERTQPAASSAG